jgi:D-alanyl-D-alanine carboxypeptidase (penicillin-binding protein 5/6)
MNARAAELKMDNTYFENVTGLDDTTEKHLTTAKDIAIMSCELIKYPIITKYSSMWQDSIRNGEFTLTNTNRLVRYYDGCNGLKTGSTNKAGYCISVSAKRGDVQLIAVIMGAKTRDIRNSEARKLLDLGFANYGAYIYGEQALEKIPVKSGVKSEVVVYSKEFKTIVEKGSIKDVEIIYDIPKNITAPIKENDIVGKIIFKIGEETIGEEDIVVKESVDRISYFYLIKKILSQIFC